MLTAAKDIKSELALTPRLWGEYIVFETQIGLSFAFDASGQNDFTRFMLISNCCGQLIVNSSSSFLACENCKNETTYRKNTSPFYRTASGLIDAASSLKDWGIASKSFTKTSSIQVLEGWLAPFGDTFSQILWVSELEKYLDKIYSELREVKTEAQAISWLKTIEC